MEIANGHANSKKENMIMKAEPRNRPFGHKNQNNQNRKNGKKKCCLSDVEDGVGDAVLVAVVSEGKKICRQNKTVDKVSCVASPLLSTVNLFPLGI